MKGSMKYILKRKNGWAIQKNINGKIFSFGLYDSLEEAQHYRDYFVEHDWDMVKRLEFSRRKNKQKPEPKNIYKCYGGGYEIRKEINHHRYFFGTYDTLEEAITAREYFVENGWKLNERLIFSKVANIQEKDGKFHIVKRIDGKLEYFGVFYNLEDAKKEVKLLRRSGWDYDALESFDETDNGKIQWLDGKLSHTTFEKKSERNDLYMALKEGLVIDE